MKIFDIHIHCIPGIDDGAQSIEEAIQMIKYGFDHGIGAYICTPHSECITVINKSEEVNGREMLAGKFRQSFSPDVRIDAINIILNQSLRRSGMERIIH